MISGWITQVIPVELLDKELPIPHIGTWSEPFRGRVTNLIGLSFGSMRFQAGEDISIHLIQEGVFGAVLLDSFDVASIFTNCSRGAEVEWNNCDDGGTPI